jgi:O-acetyl-ADP-ribose deacetylase (regulator of RNase III)
VWRGGESGKPELLPSCYRRCIELAEERAIASIAFPSISTGIYGYPIELAAEIAIKSPRESLSGDSSVQEVVFCCFSLEDLRLYERLLTAPLA